MRLHPLFALLIVALLAACADDVRIDPTYPESQKQARFKKGDSLFGASGLDLFGGKKKEEAGSGIGVNAYLWRAALDSLSFMPMTSADPFGGTIITDWHSPGSVVDERLKANVVILDRQLRADSVRVSLFRQVRSGEEWIDAEVPADAERKLEDTILTRARELKVQQEAE